MTPFYVTKLPRLLFSRFSSFGLLFLVTFAIILFLSPHNVYSADVTLAWDPNGEEDLAGYRIFYREEGQSYNYSDPAWEGTETTCTIYDLDNETIYCFVVRAFDTSANESGDSNEVCYRPNRPPVLDPIGAKTVEEGLSIEFTVTASDPDGDGLIYSASNVPTGASFNAGTQTFSWIPGFGAAGNYSVIFTVTDDGTPAQSDSEEVTVTVGDVNRPPVLNPIGAKTVEEGLLIEFTVTASDPDGDSLTYSASNVPTGASFNAGTQTFSWIPDFGAAGNYSVIFTVTDNGTPAQSDSETVNIDVSTETQAPAAPTNLRVEIEL
jgi:hypothetical protein